MTSYDGELTPGDLVAVRHPLKGRQEGRIIGSHYDYTGQQIIEVQLESEVYHAWQPTVTLVRRVVSYPSGPSRTKTIQRRIYW